MEKRKVIIVGGGIAGAATAWALVEAGVTDVLLIEAAAQPGVHSTGRNAAILRSAIPHPALHALARNSAAFYHSPPPGFSAVPLVDPVGLVLCAPGGPDSHTKESWLSDPSRAAGGKEIPWSELQRHYPYLRSEPGRAWSFPDEGVLDVHAILHGFLQQAQSRGVELQLRTPVTHLLRDGTSVVGIGTRQGEILADHVILAEGGWAGRLLPDLAEKTFRPHRRHLVVSGPDHTIDPRSPVVWILGPDEFYFRPESGGMLMSACDHVEVDVESGETLDRDVLLQVAEKALRWLPGLENPTAAHVWAGMRTFAMEDDFRIGPDPERPGLFWVAGLGGHGISCAPAVGRRAAKLLLGSDRGIDHGSLIGCSA
ncbi:MAG: NAD(P)/FAD-dependent oxidoreductase [Planctomycetota bacterium]|jgi:D-arginine dehydrogenase